MNTREIYVVILSCFLITKSYSQCGTDSIQDYDGNWYKTVLLGEQCWLGENLRVTHFADGIPVPHVIDKTGWSNLKIDDMAYSYYDNDSVKYAGSYGALYTWASATRDSSTKTNPSIVQGICPSGWHLPSDDEWKVLEMQLGMSRKEADNTGYRGKNEGSKLAGDEHAWIYGRLVDDPEFNSSGFSALPAGFRTHEGNFEARENRTLFWASTEFYDYNAWYRSFYQGYKDMTRDCGNKVYGFSVRCVKD